MSTQTTQRERLMAALAAAEHLVSIAPVEPYTVHVAHHSSWPAGTVGVELHFLHAPASLRAFAEAAGVEAVTASGEFGGAAFEETTTAGDLDGTLFRAWTQVTVAEQGPVAA